MSHVHPDKLFAYLAKHPIRRIAFVHLSQENRAKMKDLTLLAQRVFTSTEVRFPADGGQISVTKA
jgi:hypothetical protein